MSDADNNQKGKDKTVINEFEDMAKELAFQKEERAAELVIANKERRTCME